MEQDRSAVPDLSEGKEHGDKELAGEVAGDAGPARRDAAPEKENASAADNAGLGDAASESDEGEDFEEALAEESEVIVVGNAVHGAAWGSAKDKGHEVPQNPWATRFRFRATIAHPTPPTTYRRLPLRSRKQYYPTRLIAAGAASATTRSATSTAAQTADQGVSAMSVADQSVSAMSITTTTDQGVSAMSTVDQGAKNDALGSTVMRCELDATVDMSCSDDRKSGTDSTNTVAAALASSSCRQPSRTRKQRRPDHFIPEEAKASARAKARRSNIALDRFLTSLVGVPPEQRPEWVRNVTAEDVDSQRGTDGFRTVSGEGPEEPDDRARILAVLAVLGASLVLCVVTFVLFHTIGRSTEHGPSDEHQK